MAFDRVKANPYDRPFDGAIEAGSNSEKFLAALKVFI